MTGELSLELVFTPGFRERPNRACSIRLCLGDAKTTGMSCPMVEKRAVTNLWRVRTGSSLHVSDQSLTWKNSFHEFPFVDDQGAAH